jgi:hypothetical protein
MTAPPTPGVLRNEVSAQGSLPATVSVPVVAPVLAKTVANGVSTAAPNASIDFEIQVTNPADTALVNASLTDNVFFADAGSSTEAPWQAPPVPSITLGQHQTKTIPVSASAPSKTGVLRNEVSSPGSVPASVSVPIVPLLLAKSVTNGAQSVAAGTPVDFTVTITNPADTPFTNPVVTDAVFFTPQGSSTESILPPSPSLTVPALAAHQTVTIPVSATAPGAGVLRNEVSAPGSIPASASITVVVNPPPPGPATPLINEIVATPIRDWNDSGPGGNGVPFDDAPGSNVAPSGDVTVADQWIEIRTLTGSPAELNNWTLSFTDTSGASATMTLTPAMLKTNGTVYMIIGAPPGGVAPTSIVTLKDTTNQLIDSINLAAIAAALGPATGVGDEAIARVPDSVSTGQAADFQRRAASIGKPNP